MTVLNKPYSNQEQPILSPGRIRERGPQHSGKIIDCGRCPVRVEKVDSCWQELVQIDRGLPPLPSPPVGVAALCTSSLFIRHHPWLEHKRTQRLVI